MHVHFPMGKIADYTKKYDEQAIFNSNNTNLSSLGILNMIPTTTNDIMNLTSSLSLNTNIYKQSSTTTTSTTTTTTTTNNNKTGIENIITNYNHDVDDANTSSSIYPLEDLFLSNSMYHIRHNNNLKLFQQLHHQSSIMMHDNFCPINNNITIAPSFSTAADTTDTNTTIITNDTNLLNNNNKIIKNTTMKSTITTTQTNFDNKFNYNINISNDDDDDDNDYYTTHISLGNNPRQSLYKKQTIVESLHAFVQQFNIERNIYLQEYINYLCYKFNIKIDDA